jgi:inhibitor of KinA sporulation pathway (predicted exonuclease)
MGTFKLQFKGTAHRADIDAVNTLALFFKFLERQRGLENLLHDAKSI